MPNATDSDIKIVPDRPQSEPQPMAMIEAAIKQGFDPERLGRLMDLQERHELKLAKETYATALAGFQNDCPMVPKRRDVPGKGGVGVKYRFAGYEDVLYVAKPHLNKWGISHSFSTPPVAAGVFQIVCRLRVGSWSEDHPYTCQAPNITELAKAMFCNEAQAQGAWLSYMKRYALCGAAGIVVCDEDKDAGAVENPTLNDGHIIALNVLIEQSGADLPKLLNWIGVQSLGDIPASRFTEVAKKLERKMREVKR